MGSYAVHVKRVRAAVNQGNAPQQARHGSCSLPAEENHGQVFFQRRVLSVRVLRCRGKANILNHRSVRSSCLMVTFSETGHSVGKR